MDREKSSMRKIAIACIATLLSPAAASADVLKTEDLSDFAGKVMVAASRGDLASAFATLKPYVRIPESELEALRAGTLSQRDMALTRFGKPVGHECYPIELRGQYLARITCIERTEKHALPWRFYFYRTPDGWTLNSFIWNDNLPSLFPAT
jgi:hypothetical protein